MTTEPPDSFDPEPVEPREPNPMDSDELFDYEEAVEPEQTDMDLGEELEFSAGEGMVALGGAIVALVYILELFLDDYSVHLTGLTIAIVVVGLPRLDRDFVEKIAPLPVLMKLGGYLLGVAGVIQILSDLAQGNFDPFVAALAAIATYAGYAIAFLGARSIET